MITINKCPFHVNAKRRRRVRGDRAPCRCAAGAGEDGADRGGGRGDAGAAGR